MEPNILLGVLGIFMTLIGFVVWLLSFTVSSTTTTKLCGFFITMLGAILYLHPFLEIWFTFLQSAAGAVPTWAWVVVGIAVYFNLNKIYASWLDYACHHPSSLAQKILVPRPAGLPFTPHTTFDRFMLRTCGITFFFLTWCTMLIYLIFGGGIAKLLHLVPRE